MRRRTWLQKAASIAGVAGLGGWILPASGADESPLIYLSPLRSDGNLSRCQAEVWFVKQAADYYVVTQQDAWRARAVSQGLHTTRIWEGDVGVWQGVDGRHHSLPHFDATAALATDAQEHDKVLGLFASKYASSWGRWGPRFRNGLVDGSRVLLRYTRT